VRLRSMSRELRRSRKALEATNRELRDTVGCWRRTSRPAARCRCACCPGSPMVVGDYMFSHSIIPSLYLSGDFTDYFTVDEHYVVFFMADVSGHGSSSAFATVLLKNLFARKRSDYLRRGDAHDPRTRGDAGLANRELLDLDVGKYATMVVGVLDLAANSLRYSVAGHLPLPVLVSDAGAAISRARATPWACFVDAEYTEQLSSCRRRSCWPCFPMASSRPAAAEPGRQGGVLSRRLRPDRRHAGRACLAPGARRRGHGAG
jgi:sigma-B regulation protein RsbU (phosphoserine phosphatase)